MKKARITYYVLWATMASLLVWALLTVSSCGDILVVDPTPEPPVEVRPSVDWNLVTEYHSGTSRPRSHTLEIYVDGELSRSITAQNGTSVGDMYDQYLEVGNMVRIEYSILEDENGNRVIPGACETGGSIATITFSSLPEDDRYFVPVSQKGDEITVRTCTTVKDVSAKISSVSLLSKTDTRAIFLVEATEPVQCVFEYGTEPGVYNMSGIPERSFNYSTHNIGAGNVTPLEVGVTYYGRAIVRDESLTPYFSEEISWTQ